MKTGNSMSLTTTPLPPGSVGVAIGEPPSIDSPQGLEVSASGSSASNSSFVATPGKRIPGKLALCTRCGTQSTCVRCKRKLPEDVKLLDDTRSSANAIKNPTPAQRDQIVSECVDHHWSPVDLGKKWGCSPDTIRQWAKKAGKVLPKTYKRGSDYALN